MAPVIETKNLNKSFKDFKAVSDLSFSVNKGDVYGFLGQNGAGKSTTIRMLAGLIFPDNGHVFIKGQELHNNTRHLLQHIGAIIERPDMYNYLSGWDNLKIFASLSNKKIPNTRLHEVLELTGIADRRKDKVKAYSQGMKQRLGIAIAMVHDPDLLILDEPTNGLDPQGIAEMRKLILHLSHDLGKTILISSHLLYEIEHVANRMIIIHKGKKMVEGIVGDLLHPGDTLIQVSMLPDTDVAGKLAGSAWQVYVHEHTSSAITFKMDPAQVPQLNQWLVQNGMQVLEIKTKHLLEEYFISLTNDAAAKD
ncbi:MAG: ABC transporter ATP-binding protein [Flavipsychrobacter sp.]|nr:ABC transporter ATP-binding protein [Flavipsychrobacter sp.]